MHAAHAPCRASAAPTPPAMPLAAMAAQADNKRPVLASGLYLRKTTVTVMASHASSTRSGFAVGPFNASATGKPSAARS